MLEGLEEQVRTCKRRLRAAEDEEAREQYKLADVNTQLEAAQALERQNQQTQKHLDAEIQDVEAKNERQKRRLLPAGDSDIEMTRLVVKRQKQGPQKHAERRPFLPVPVRL